MTRYTFFFLVLFCFVFVPRILEIRLSCCMGFYPKDEGYPGVLANKGTLVKYQREQGNISQFLGTGNKISKNYSTKTF